MVVDTTTTTTTTTMVETSTSDRMVKATQTWWLVPMAGFRDRGWTEIIKGTTEITMATITTEAHLVLPVIVKLSGCRVPVTVRWANPPITPWSNVWICRGGKKRKYRRR